MLLAKEIVRKAGLIILSILLSLFIAELALQLVCPQQTKYFVWQPNLQHTFHPNSTIFYGISGAKQFSINSQGFRGEESENGSKGMYICLGGSTTECLYLDDKETWQYQMQLLLDSRTALPPLIGSIGKSGCATRENYIQLKYYVPQLGKIEGVILMVGINDMMKRLSSDTLFENDFRFTPQVEDSFVNTIFLSDRNEEEGWRKVRLFQFVRNAFQRATKVEWQNVQDDEGKIYKTWRENRQHALAISDTLPDLTSALKEYERNLQLIYAETKRQGIKLILVNQPALYKDSMSAYENSLLWMGGIGNFQEEPNHPYYTPKALRQGIELYNQCLEDFCSNKQHVKFVNLATQLPRDTSVFYDDCHFNESGARKVAEIISREIIQ